MKKKLAGTLKCTVCILLISFNHCIAQTNAVSISVSGVEYDDPAFSLLKESLQKIKNVSAVKQTYTQGTGKLTVSYPGSAQSLWEAMPKSTKDFFKVTGIDDAQIGLQYKNAKETAVKTTQEISSNKSDDCRNCYWNLCKYDGIKTFQGVVFKQINRDDGTFYYNCDNGVVVVKQVFVNGYGVTTNITNDTLLVSSGPIGTSWGVQSGSTTLFGMNTQFASSNTLIAKEVTTTVNGIVYKDVIVINKKRFSSDNFLDNKSETTSLNEYYARGVGLIKSENADPGKDAVQAVHKSRAYEDLPGGIDQSIVGSWKHKDADSPMEFTYKFNNDGTYEYYVGPDRWFTDLACNWKVNGNKIVFLRSDIQDPYASIFKKKNDPVTGKPILVIQFRDDEYRDYISLDNKPPW